MAVDLDELLLKLKWQEEGANVPAGARAQLQNLVRAQQALTQTTVAGVAPQQAAAQAAGVAAAKTEDLGHKVRRTSQDAIGAGRSVGLLRSALSVYAFQAVGAAGTTGRLAQGLLLFGAGSTITLGAVAGLALIAAGFRLITREARESEERIKAARDRLKELEEETDPALGIQREIDENTRRRDAALKRLNEERDRLDRLARERIALAAQVGVNVPFAQARQNLLREGAVPDLGRAVREVGTLNGVLEQLAEKLARVQEEASKAEKELLQALRAGDAAAAMAPGRALAIRAQFPGFAGGPQSGTLPAGFRPGVFGQGGGNAPGTFAAASQAGQAAIQQQHYAEAIEATRGILIRTITPQQLYTQQLAQVQLALDLGAISAAEFDLAVKQLTEDLQKAKKGSAVLGVAIIGMVAGTIAAVIQGGSATSVIGGILGTVGGIVGITNPLLGAGIAGLGQVVSAAGSRGVTIDRYGETALSQLKGIPSGPERIEFLIASASMGEIVDRVIYTLGSRRRTDAVPRVPGIILAIG